MVFKHAEQEHDEFRIWPGLLSVSIPGGLIESIMILSWAVLLL